MTQLDTLRTIETPEGVALHLSVAGIWVRAAGWLIDMLIRGGIYISLGFLLGLFDRLGMGLLLIAVFLLEWFYPVLFEVLNRGMTPGKKLMAICVVNGDGTPVTWSSSMLRNMMRVVDFLPMFYGFGFISMLAGRDFRRLGDMVADTLVIYRQPDRLPQAVPVAEPLALPCSLLDEEQVALISFAGRVSQMTPERADELAHILAPFFEPAQKTVNTDTLVRFANGLLRH